MHSCMMFRMLMFLALGNLVASEPALAQRIVRFLDELGEEHFGEERGDGMAELLHGHVFDSLELSGKVAKVQKILAPLDPKTVPAVYCIGLNYVKHAQDFNYSIPTSPVIFFKNRQSIAAPGATVVIPKLSTMPDYEAELAVVIGKDAKDVSEADALDYVLGYAITNDVSGRCWQGVSNGPDPKGNKCPGNSGQWSFSKSFDTHLPFGPAIVTPSALPSPDAKGLNVTMTLNGEVVQSDMTQDMIFDVKQVISFISQGTTIEKGTIISMGTPSGVGEEWRNKDGLGLQGHLLRHGDVMTAKIDKIGSLTNPVSAAHLGSRQQEVVA